MNDLAPLTFDADLILESDGSRISVKTDEAGRLLICSVDWAKIPVSGVSQIRSILRQWFDRIDEVRILQGDQVLAKFGQSVRPNWIGRAAGFKNLHASLRGAWTLWRLK